MIISVEKLKQFIVTDVADEVLEAKLLALEASIRKKTNNNFQDRRYRTTGNVDGNHITVENHLYFDIDDTIMVDEDLVVIKNRVGNTFTLSEYLLPKENALVTKVVYPADVVMGVVEIMSWSLANPSDKAGIASETLSRHSVTYQGASEYDSDIGCPARLLSFLKQYQKARF